jgi:Uma2 family endonuclease
MSVHAPSPKLTYQDLLRMPEDGLRHELIDGEHYVSPSPSWRHQTAVANLVWILSTFVRERRLGWLRFAPLDVFFSDFDVVEPDVLFVSRARSDGIRERCFEGAPDLVVEVLSPSTRRVDLEVKRRLYEGRGVPEYWLVDPVAETVEVDRAAGGRFERQPALTAAAGDRLRSPLFPGLEIPLSGIFEDSDPP